MNESMSTAFNQTTQKTCADNKTKTAGLLLFIIGMLCPPIVFVASGLVAGPDWSGTSAVLDFLAVPLMALGAGLCFAAPFLLPMKWGARVLYGFAALVGFGVVSGVVAYVSLIIFGLPVR